MTSKNLPDEDPIVHVHKHVHMPRPLAVSNDEDAARFLGVPHRRHTYKALGVPVTELPGGRFAVLLVDVEQALRARGAAPSQPTPTSSDEPDIEALAARAGLRVTRPRVL